MRKLRRTQHREYTRVKQAGQQSGIPRESHLAASADALILNTMHTIDRRAAYYFFNTLTNEVTWQNPLEGDASSGNAEASTSAAPAEDQGPDLGGIDPELAFLDPTLKRQLQGGSGATPAFQARFNSRTGRFQVSCRGCSDL